jgi:hypothetical protein
MNPIDRTMQNSIRNSVTLILASVIFACSADEGSDSGGSMGSSAGRNSVGTPSGAGTTGSSAGAVATGTAGGAAGTAAAACPALRPVEDAACTTNPQICTYDEIECGCPAGKWSCAEPVDPNCPPMMPVHASVCTVPEATECEFLQDECECNSGRWSCESQELEDDAGTPNTPPTTPPMTMPDAGPPSTAFDAGMVDCPDLRPIEGFSCTPSRTGCMYDTTHCVCPEGMWLCNESVDPTCPIEPPTPGSACAGRADCDYFDIECECLRSMWSCKGND